MAARFFELKDRNLCCAATGMQLLPESYQALIYSALETDPPDSELAFALFDDVKRKALDPTPAWRMLCTRLWARGLREEALGAAQEGRLAGYDMDGEVAEVMMEGLCVDGRDLVGTGFRHCHALAD